MRNKIIAIMYDFDKTLCTRDMQEYTFLPNLGIEPNSFWNETNKFKYDNKMDQVLCYMYLMLMKMNDRNLELKKDYLNDMGKNIELFPGVVDWFDRINEYGRSLGFEIEHYIISAGLKEIIEGCNIGDKFKCIYASEFLYDSSNNAIWPKLAVNYTNKTQFLMRINKGILDLSDDDSLNDKMLENERRISTANMIYIGDGFTDVPCMKLTKESGGVSVAVYANGDDKLARKLLNDGRINYMVKADYREGADMDKIIKKVIHSMVINTELKNETLEQAYK